MHRIERRRHGFVLTFAGMVRVAEMTLWLEESKRQLQKAGPAFGVIIDIRRLAPLDGESQVAMVDGQELFKKNGMTRSAVIVADPKVARQYGRLAEQSGIATNVRIIDACRPGDWSAIAVSWVRDALDPDAWFPRGPIRRHPKDKPVRFRRARARPVALLSRPRRTPALRPGEVRCRE